MVKSRLTGKVLTQLARGACVVLMDDSGLFPTLDASLVGGGAYRLAEGTEAEWDEAGEPPPLDGMRDNVSWVYDPGTGLLEAQVTAGVEVLPDVTQAPRLTGTLVWDDKTGQLIPLEA